MAIVLDLHDAKPRVTDVSMVSSEGGLSEVSLKLFCGRNEAERIVRLAHKDNVDIVAQNSDEA